MKTCKQCGVSREESCFQTYASRSQGIRESKPGLHTICKKCESFNRKVTVAYKADPRTEEQQRLLENAEKIYKFQIQQGLHPVGKFARSLYENAEYSSVFDTVEQYMIDCGPEPLRKLHEMLLQRVDNLALYKSNYERYEDELYELHGGSIEPVEEKLLSLVSDRIRAYEKITV